MWIHHVLSHSATPEPWKSQWPQKRDAQPDNLIFTLQPNALGSFAALSVHFSPPKPLFAFQLIPVPNTFISLPFGWCHDNEKLIKRQLGMGFWRFYASTRWSRGDPQQNRLIDWEAAGNGETHQVGWRIWLTDASADNANKNRLGGVGEKKFNNYICSLKDGGLKSAH